MKFLFLVMISFFVPGVAAIAAESDECNRLELEILTTPAPPANIGSLGSLKTATVSESIDFALIGDSIANQLSAAKLPQLVGSVNPLVMTGGGDGFQHALFKLNYFEERIKGKSPKKAVLVLGTNNIGYSQCALQTGFENYFTKLKTVWPNTKFFVLPILPRGNGFPANDIFNGYNNYLKARSVELGYSVIDIDTSLLTCGLEGSEMASRVSVDKANAYSKLMQCSATFLEEINNEVKVFGNNVSFTCHNDVTLSCSNYRPDNIHLSNSGVTILKDTIAKSVADK